MYFRVKSNMYEKFIMALNAQKRDPNKQIDPRDINAATRIHS